MIKKEYWMRLVKRLKCDNKRNLAALALLMYRRDRRGKRFLEVQDKYVVQMRKYRKNEGIFLDFRCSYKDGYRRIFW